MDQLDFANAKRHSNWEFETLDCCPLCGGNGFDTTYSRNVNGIPLSFMACRSCSFVFQNPRMTPQALADYFSSSTFICNAAEGNQDLDELLGYDNYFEWDASYKRTASLRLKKIMRHVRPPGRALEIGSATGAFLAETRDRGFEVQGLDISSTFAAIATKSYGLDIRVGSIEETELPENFFDLVCSWGGIACWRSPADGLRNVAHTLKDGGIFALNHPHMGGLFAKLTGDSCFEYNHASLSLFTDATMTKFLEASGFETLSMGREWQFASLGRILTYLRCNRAMKLLRGLKLQDVDVPVVAFGTTFRVCRLRKR